MEPVTIDTAGSSSLVPCPNELSEVPEGRSMPAAKPDSGATHVPPEYGKSVHQSVLPEVWTVRFPSPPSNELPGRLAKLGRANAANARTVTVRAVHRVRLPRIRFFIRLILSIGALGASLPEQATCPGTTWSS